MFERKKCVKKCHKNKFFSKFDEEKKAEPKMKKTRFFNSCIVVVRMHWCGVNERKRREKKTIRTRRDCYRFGSKAGNDSTNAYAAVPAYVC